MLWLKRLISINTLKYSAIMVVGFACDLILFAILTSYEISIIVSGVASFVFGTFVNLMLLRSVLFNCSNLSFAKDFILTLLSNGLIFNIGLLLLWYMTSYLLYDAIVAKVFSNLLTFLSNYVVRIVFFER
jgi:putative flippase GtrA